MHLNLLNKAITNITFMHKNITNLQSCENERSNYHPTRNIIFLQSSLYLGDKLKKEWGEKFSTIPNDITQVVFSSVLSQN